jgi:hypothetical protein
VQLPVASEARASVERIEPDRPGAEAGTTRDRECRVATPEGQEAWRESGIALGWDDIKHLSTGTVSKTFQDDTLPGGPREKTIIYQAPFFKPDREEDYRVAWKHFAGETEAGSRKEA